MFRSPIILIAVVGSCVAAEPTFEKDVLPVFAESCVSCHGPEKQKAGFRADRLAEFLEPGGRGPWVIPGDSEASKLVGLLSGDIKPKKEADKHQLPSAQVQMIRLWIDSGAD